jgi:hypothetical protein
MKMVIVADLPSKTTAPADTTDKNAHSTENCQKKQKQIDMAHGYATGLGYPRKTQVCPTDRPDSLQDLLIFR